jgi:hypothetical protein
MNLGESLLEREATTDPEPTLVIRIPGFISSVANSASENQTGHSRRGISPA